MSKKDLIKLLKDDEIQRIIQEISAIKNDDTTAISQELQECKEENMGLLEKIKKLVNCLKDEELKVEAQSKKVKEKSEIIKTQSKKIDRFEKYIESYEIYETLSSDTKESLKGIFKDNSLEGFLACGVQEKSINSFWEYLKSELIEEHNVEIEKLLRIFEFFFKQYTLAFPNIEKQSVAIGEKYNTNIHIKQKGKQSGVVESVVMYGWVNNLNSKVIKKSLVVVK